jgi:hypothetical protein
LSFLASEARERNPGEKDINIFTARALCKPTKDYNAYSFSYYTPE